MLTLIAEAKEVALLYEIKLNRLIVLEQKLNRAVGLIGEELSYAKLQGATDEELRRYRWLRNLKAMLDPESVTK